MRIRHAEALRGEVNRAEIRLNRIKDIESLAKPSPLMDDLDC